MAFLHQETSSCGGRRTDPTTYGAEDERVRLRQTFSTLPSGVTAVCGDLGRAPASCPIGMTASSFVSVSLTPPLASICIDERSSTWPQLRTLARFGVSFLSDTQGAIARQLAGGRADRFSGVDLHRAGSQVYISGATAWLSCSLAEEVPAGDHCIAVLRVHEHRWWDLPPLVFHRSGFPRLSSKDQALGGESPAAIHRDPGLPPRLPQQDL